MSLVTQAKCFRCAATFTQVNHKPWACPGCFPKEAEQLKLLKENLKLTNELYDDLKAKVQTLFETISHGDAKHQKWLADKIVEHFGKHL